MNDDAMKKLNDTLSTMIVVAAVIWIALFIVKVLCFIPFSMAKVLLHKDWDWSDFNHFAKVVQCFVLLIVIVWVSILYFGSCFHWFGM